MRYIFGKAQWRVGKFNAGYDALHTLEKHFIRFVTLDDLDVFWCPILQNCPI